MEFPLLSKVDFLVSQMSTESHDTMGNMSDRESTIYIECVGSLLDRDFIE